MNVSLTPELERFIKDQVETGQYQTASEVVREGLRLLIERRRALNELDGKIERGLADVAAGRTFEPDEARNILRQRRKARVS